MHDPEQSSLPPAQGLLIVALAVLAFLASAASPAAAALVDAPTTRAAPTCADYPNQAAARRAADTRDPDGDGIYCVIYPR